MNASKLHSHIINDQQRYVLNMLSVLFAFAGVIFFFLNMYRGLIPLAVVELIMSCISFWLYFKISKITDYRVFQKAAFCYLFLFYGLMAFAFWQKSTSVTIFVWVLLIPILSYVLLGRKLGFYMTAVFVTINLFIFFHTLQSDSSILHAISLANILLCISILWLTAHAYERGNAVIKSQLADMAIQDNLTGLFNRNALHLFFEQHQADDVLSMVIFDIDWFKKINDNYGHDAGDKALQIISHKLQDAFNEKNRPEPDANCYVLRIGGEEFCVLLPQVSLAECIPHIRQVMKDIETSTVKFDGNSFSLTLSAGIAEYPREHDNLAGLQKLADTRLYQAKNSGRNKLVSS